MHIKYTGKDSDELEKFLIKEGFSPSKRDTKNRPIEWSREERKMVVPVNDRKTANGMA